MNFFKDKRFRLFKYEALMLLAGVSMIFIAGLFENKETKEALPTEYSTQPQASPIKEMDYASAYEYQIENLVKKIDGVRGASAAVYVRSEGVKIPAYNENKDNSVITEKSGTEEAEEKRDASENNLVIIKDSQGNESAVILTEEAPEILGIAVCVEGLESKQIEEKILKLLMSLYDLPASKICITW